MEIERHMKKIKKGDIYLADMDPAKGSEQGGVRPVLVIQNNKGNKYSPTTIVACLTSRVHTKANLPTHYLLPDDIGLKYPSMVMLEQIFTIDKTRLIKYITRIPKPDMYRIELQIRRSFDMRRRRFRRTRYGRQQDGRNDP
jgi:mRNA interferase MazF